MKTPLTKQEKKEIIDRERERAENLAQIAEKTAKIRERLQNRPQPPIQNRGPVLRAPKTIPRHHSDTPQKAVIRNPDGSYTTKEDGLE